jgi:hypothetical protein
MKLENKHLHAKYNAGLSMEQALPFQKEAIRGNVTSSKQVWIPAGQIPSEFKT